MTYTLVEHRHRFAAWAAGRAAGTKNCRFRVEEGCRLLDSTDIPDYAADWEGAAETPDAFDARHRQWRERIVAQALEKGIGANSGSFTHGVAAKLINVYLKSMIVCAVAPSLKEAPARAGIVHPPIDRLLLEALGKLAKAEALTPKRGRNHWQNYAALGWSNFTSDHYEEVIGAIRMFANGQPLWLVEEHWVGHQNGSKTEDM